jgi:hypothetical protein
MHILAAILTVLLTVMQALSPISRNAADNHAGSGNSVKADGQNKQGKTAPVSLVVDPAKGEPATNDSGKIKPADNQQPVRVTELPSVSITRDLIDHLTVVFSGVLVLVGCGGVYIGLKGLDAARDAAKAALLQANYLIASERSWLIPKITNPAWDDVMNPQSKPQGWYLPIEVTINTFGKTTAIVINRFITSYSETTADRYGVPLKPKLPKTLPYTILSGAERKAVDGTLYAPGEPFFMYLAISKETLEKHNAAWRSGEECLCVMGFVEYRNVFGKHHITRFCYAYQGVVEGGSLVNAITRKPIISPEFQKVDIPGYNEST